MAKSTIEVGENYCVELDGELASCRVWSRPDLDSDTGARLAAQKVAICRSLALGSALGMLFDLREAPKVTGPKTQYSISQILSAWETAARPIAIVVSPASMQKLQLARLVGDSAPRHGCVFLEVDLALQWLRMRVPRRSVPPARAASSQPAPRAALSPPTGPQRAFSPVPSLLNPTLLNPTLLNPTSSSGVQTKPGINPSPDAERGSSLRAGSAIKKRI